MTLGPFTVHLWLATRALGSPSPHSSHVLPIYLSCSLPRVERENKTLWFAPKKLSLNHCLQISKGLGLEGQGGSPTIYSCGRHEWGEKWRA